MVSPRLYGEDSVVARAIVQVQKRKGPETRVAHPGPIPLVGSGFTRRNCLKAEPSPVGHSARRVCAAHRCEGVLALLHRVGVLDAAGEPLAAAAVLRFAV
jgi:hypothetical protein